MSQQTATALEGPTTADARPKPFVFVLMPFKDEFNDTYQLGIRAACEAAGAYCERVDEQVFDGSILQRIYNQIDKADIVIADMSGQSPNVFYETGYAHDLGKRVILLKQDTADIPFDLKQYPHIVYGGRIVQLKSGTGGRGHRGSGTGGRLLTIDDLAKVKS